LASWPVNRFAGSTGKQANRQTIAMVKCYLGIGSNLGDRQAYIDTAIEEIGKIRDVRLIRASTIYETDPVSDVPQGKFLNGVLEIEAVLDPRSLLKELNKVESLLGRKRDVKNSPRTIDLDILYYGNERIKENGLEIPHPRIHEREFVLKGLRELRKR